MPRNAGSVMICDLEAIGRGVYQCRRQECRQVVKSPHPASKIWKRCKAFPRPNKASIAFEDSLQIQFRATLRSLIVSKRQSLHRSTDEIHCLLDAIPGSAWPCGGNADKVQAFIADVLDPNVWRDEWGTQPHGAI